MDITDKVLALVRMKGPLIPAQIAKELGQNIMMSSAILASMSSKNVIKVSNIKIGGSPLYYVPGQEYKLQNYADKMHEKERRAFELIRNEKVLEDKGLDLLYRVTLRQIKDFAKPVEVMIEGEPRIFWKWYLLTSDDTEQLIREKYFPEMMQAKEIEEPQKIPEVKEEQKELVVPTETKQEPKQEQKQEQKPVQKQVIRRAAARTDDFPAKTAGFFRSSGIEIVEQKLIKRDTETDYIILVPSAVGKIKYYCKARKKSMISETDIGAAFAQGQVKNMPILYVTTGELTKKAKEALQREYGSITVKQI